MLAVATIIVCPAIVIGWRISAMIFWATVELLRESGIVDQHHKFVPADFATSRLRRSPVAASLGKRPQRSSPVGCTIPIVNRLDEVDTT